MCFFYAIIKQKKENKMEIIRDKEELKKKIDLAEYIGRYVDLQPRGNTLVGASPVRAERTPSFYVIPSKGIWKDFAGGTGRGSQKKGGTYLNFTDMPLIRRQVSLMR